MRDSCDRFAKLVRSADCGDCDQAEFNFVKRKLISLLSSTSEINQMQVDFEEEQPIKNSWLRELTELLVE